MNNNTDDYLHQLTRISNLNIKDIYHDQKHNIQKKQKQQTSIII